MLLLLAGLASADTVTLDNGATLAADLARYELDGDCQMTVTEGELTGAILIVPCHRVKAFSRSTPAAPVVLRAQPAPVALPAPRGVTAVGALDAEADVVAVDVVAADVPAPLDTPAMPDSIAALEHDDFITPLPAADEGFGAPDAEEDAEEDAEAESEAEAAPAVEAPGLGVPREAPPMGRIDHDVEF